MREKRWSSQTLSQMSPGRFLVLTVILKNGAYRMLGIPTWRVLSVNWAPNEDLVIRWV